MAPIDVLAALLRDPDEELDAPDVLALARVVPLVSSANQRTSEPASHRSPPLSGRTQYGRLLRDAGRHILAANVELANQQFADRETAERAAIVYLDLLHALHRHGRQLMGSDVRLRGIGATSDADPRD